MVDARYMAPPTASVKRLGKWGVGAITLKQVSWTRSRYLPAALKLRSNAASPAVWIGRSTLVDGNCDS